MKFRRLVSLFVAVACCVYVQPGMHAVATTPSSAQVQQPTIAAAAGTSITGTVLRDGKSVSDVRLQLRSVDTTSVVGRTVSDQNGAFSFTVPQPGLYVVEAVKDDGRVIAVGGPLNVGTTAITTTVVLPATKAFFAGAAFLILTTAAAAGIGAWAIANGGDVSSPER